MITSGDRIPAKHPPGKTHQNSYRLKSKQPFDIAKVKVHLKNILEMNFKEIEYADGDAKELILNLSEEIKTAVKNEKYDRYRILVVVFIGDKKMQGLRIHHSFVWDQDRDKYVEHLYETSSFYCLAIVYGIYYE